MWCTCSFQTKCRMNINLGLPSSCILGDQVASAHAPPCFRPHPYLPSRFWCPSWKACVSCLLLPFATLPSCPLPPVPLPSQWYSGYQSRRGYEKQVLFERFCESRGAERQHRDAYAPRRGAPRKRLDLMTWTHQNFTFWNGVWCYLTLLNRFALTANLSFHLLLESDENLNYC